MTLTLTSSHSNTFSLLPFITPLFFPLSIFAIYLFSSTWFFFLLFLINPVKSNLLFSQSCLFIYLFITRLKPTILAILAFLTIFPILITYTNFASTQRLEITRICLGLNHPLMGFLSRGYFLYVNLVQGSFPLKWYFRKLSFYFIMKFQNRNFLKLIRFVIFNKKIFRYIVS